METGGPYPPESDILLPLEVAGLRFRNPFVVGSGPTVKTPEMIREIERCGWGAASVKLSIDPAYLSLPPRYRWFRKERYHVFTAETRLTPEESLRLVGEGRRAVRDLVLLANFAYAGPEGEEGWVRIARKFEAAGAHALELNLCCPNMSFNVQASGGRAAALSGASVGADAGAVSGIVRAVARAVRIPVFAKLTPEGGRVALVARACFEAGAAAAGTTGNRLGIPEFDVRHPERSVHPLQDEPALCCFSGPWLKPLALRDVYEIRRAVGPGPCVLGAGGVETWTDAVQMMMCGADLVQVCTATMIRGFGILGGLVGGIRKFLEETGRTSCRDVRDLVVRHVRGADGLHVRPGHARVDPGKCTGCGLCVKIGHCRALAVREKKAAVDPAACTGCGTCTDVCPAGAITLVLREEAR